jgi:hypothetical protein
MRDACGLLIAGQGAARGHRRATGEERDGRRRRCRHLRSHYGGSPGLGAFSPFAKLCMGASMRGGEWRTVFPDRGGQRAC